MEKKRGQTLSLYSSQYVLQSGSCWLTSHRPMTTPGPYRHTINSLTDSVVTIYLIFTILGKIRNPVNWERCSFAYVHTIVPGCRQVHQLRRICPSRICSTCMCIDVSPVYIDPQALFWSMLYGWDLWPTQKMGGCVVSHE